ncbi:MAG TPA: Gfo/Idh/MocA family oxidoreductase [Planctomycetes bacterium]|nr:Gfo/Idh/MocA family oxidoreductase [Planctomycetota bacterium]HIJ70787.1 Gfo/Idh/MocA family oxidoreductase [Planctomycetota bacterium]
MIRAGVVGMGFIGQVHAKCYQETEGAQLVAVCDIDETKLKSAGRTEGNIEQPAGALDLTNVELYTDFDEMLDKAGLDAVSIALPTSMHAEYTIKALDAGLGVLCEKPLAPNISQCEQIINAAQTSGTTLQVGHCIRFWPEYAKTKEVIDSGEYGKVRAADFRRLGSAPAWSWNQWMMDAAQSGGALMDLHIHDSDYVQYAFGMPTTVYTRCTKGPSSKYDHIATHYLYDDDRVITAEGSWLMSPGFGFEMSFNIVLEEATIVFDNTRKTAFRICPADKDPFTPEILPGDGWSLEIAHFIKAVSGEKVPKITTPADSLDSVRLVLAERQSAETGKAVAIE